MYKFRTMYSGSDKAITREEYLQIRLGTDFKLKRDPRVTHIGYWLRRFSLDELPQLFNVLRGDMTLVGPRPQVRWEYESCNEHSRRRINVMPGITGLWQVAGRANLTFEDMMNLDIYYLENWSPGLDLKIILKTIPAVVSGRGAY